ncbi:hypothetical protein SEA_COLUCCI_96 [Arthrobacter phage Colucci]|uniref:Uncharacterized protein n=1 Tax=Arthrobacter phage Colucci TaxID=2015834 RepID=A0A286N308_9CAUD|nr:hypothetical protein FDI27_gp096 [Arthrobacter phage Colucci]ASX98765.1 hypothetical protein SEA_COLUCCI_96 [Arthrobacter phage Colucci]
MSNPIKEYLNYTNDDGTRALTVNPQADGGVFLKLSTVLPNGQQQLGSIIVTHDAVPRVLFEIAGGNPTEQDVEEARAIAESIATGDQSLLNIGALARRVLLALHFNIHGIPPREEVPAPDAEPSRCAGCASVDEAYADAAHDSHATEAMATMQDPDYDPNAEELADPVDDTNYVAKLAAENASLRNKLAAIQALTSPHVNL